MSYLSWNCRGLGQPQCVHELRFLVRRFQPSFLFLCETKLRGREMDGLRSSLSFFGSVYVDCVGRSGGLGLFWNTDEVVSLLSFLLAILMFLLLLCLVVFGVLLAFMVVLNRRIEVLPGICLNITFSVFLSLVVHGGF